MDAKRDSGGSLQGKWGSIGESERGSDVGNDMKGEIARR
jgi:hypothetical protein